MSNLKGKISLFLAMIMIAMAVMPMALVLADEYAIVNVTVNDSNSRELKSGNTYTDIKSGDRINISAECTNQTSLFYSQNSTYMNQFGYKMNDKGMALLGYLWDDEADYHDFDYPTQGIVTVPNFDEGSIHNLYIHGSGAFDGNKLDNGSIYHARSSVLQITIVIPKAQDPIIEPEQDPTTITIGLKDGNKTVTSPYEANPDDDLIATATTNLPEGIASVSYKWDNGTYKKVNGPSVVVTIPADFEPGSTHTLYIKAVAADGTTTEKQYTITIPKATEPEKDPTTVTVGLKDGNKTVTSPYETETGKELTASGTTNLPEGISSVSYKWDDDNYTKISAPSTVIKVPTKFKPGESHTLTIKAEAADGTSAVKQYTITIPKENEPENKPDEGGELIVEPWMKENDNAEGLLVSLRNEPVNDKENKNMFALNENVKYFVDFKNATDKVANKVKVELELPLDVTVVDADGGAVSGKKITWEYPNGLAAGAADTKAVIVKYTSLGKSSIKSKMVYPVAAIYESNKMADSSAVINLIYKDTETELGDEHYPYMYGDKNADTFRPDDGISRAEGALVLTRIFGMNTSGVEVTRVFSDLDETYLEAQQAIVAATKVGLINGYKDGTYRPNEKMTRAEFMKIMAGNIELAAKENGLGEKVSNGLRVKDSAEEIKIYKDPTRIYLVNGQSVEEHWASPYVTLLARLNMTDLTNKNQDLRLDETISRAEVAQQVNFYLFRAPAETDSRTKIGFSDVTRKHRLFADIIEATRAAHTYMITENGTEYVEN